MSKEEERIRHLHANNADLTMAPQATALTILPFSLENFDEIRKEVSAKGLCSTDTLVFAECSMPDLTFGVESV